MCSCHSILECCVTFSGVKLSIRSFVLFLFRLGEGGGKLCLPYRFLPCCAKMVCSRLTKLSDF